MKKILLLLAIISILLTGCFAPVNLTFESAKTLNKGEIDVQGNYSSYYEPWQNSSMPGFFNTNNNFGTKVGYGINDRYTIKFRYEHFAILTSYDFELFDLSGLSDHISVNYFEIENKFKFKHANIAFGAPIGYYSFWVDNKATNGAFSIDPRVYFTFFGSSSKFELNFIPKAHILLIDGMIFQPGVCLGFGFSSDLKKWAIRPEVGFDGYVSFGISLNLNLSSIIKTK